MPVSYVDTFNASQVWQLSMSKVARYLNHMYQLFTQNQSVYLQVQLTWKQLEEKAGLVGWRAA